MKGTTLDFLNLAAQKPELAKDLANLATKHGFQFSGELSDDDLESVSGGGTMESATQGAGGSGIGSTDSSVMSEMWAAEQEKDEQMVASTQEHINRLSAMIREMQKIQSLSYDSTSILP
jgi:hypothetical protein